MTQILPSEQRHAELGERGLRRVLAAGHDPVDAQASVNYWYPRVADSFGRAGSAHLDTYRRFGLRQRPQRGAARPLAGRRGADPGRARPHRPAEALTMRLESFVAGRWVPGSGRPTVLAHAVTGEPFAEIDATGLDFAAMLASRPRASAARPCAGSPSTSAPCS